MSGHETAPPARENQAPPPPRRRKRRARLASGCLVAFLLVLVALLILNGPGFRTLARFAGLKAAASQGLTGDFRVLGSIGSGFSIQALDLSDGKEDGMSIRVEEVRLDYHPWTLLTQATQFGWLEKVRIGKAEIRLVLPESAEDPDNTFEKPPRKTKPDRSGEAPADFSPFWNLLAAGFEIEDLTLSVHQGDRVISVESLQLDVPSGSDGSLKLARLSLPGQPGMEQVEATIRKGSRSLSIGPVSLLGYAELESLAVSEPDPGRFELLAAIAAAGGTLDLAAKAPVSGPVEVSLGLRRGSSLSLETLPLPESKLRGEVSGLELSFAGDPAKPAGWKLDGKVIASKTGWDRSEVDSLALLISDSRLSLEALRGRAQVRVEASLPLVQAETMADLAALPIQASVLATVPSLAETVSDFGTNLPLAGSLTLEARDVQIEKGRLRSGSLLLLPENLSWDGVSLSGAQLAARVERDNFLRLALDLGLDENSRVHLAAATDLTAKSYEGEAKVVLATQGRLGTVLADLKQDRFTGAVSLEWKGKGSLGSEGHEGEARIALDAFTIGSGRPIDGAIAASYSGRSARMETLSLKCDGVALTGTGLWDGTKLALPDWRLNHEGRSPLTLALDLPLEPATEGGFLAQEGPISLSLVLDRLEMDELTRFFTAAPPIAGRLQGEVEANGSFAGLDLKSQLEFRPARQPAPVSTPEPAPVDAPAIPAPLATLDLAWRGAPARPASWETTLTALLTGLSWNGMALENLTLDASTDTGQPERPLLATLRFDQSSTLLDARARLDLEGVNEIAGFSEAPVLVDASLKIGSLSTLLSDLAPPKLKGLPLNGSLEARIDGLRLERGSLHDGEIQVSSPDLSLEGQTFERLQLDASIPDADRVEAALTVALDKQTRVEGRGGFHLKEKRYEGELDLSANLASGGGKLRQLLENRPLADLLPGSTTLVWKGQGSLPETDHTGEVTFRAEALRLAAGAEPLDAELSGRYSADSAEFPVLKLVSRPLNFDGSLQWQEHLLNLKGTALSGDREVLTLSSSLPLDPAKLKPGLWFAQETPLSVDLSLDALAIGPLSQLLLEKPPVLGDLDLDLSVSGSPAEPRIDLDLDLGGLTVPREGQTLPVGQLTVKAEAGASQLALSGEYRHPEVQPLTLEASLPFHPGAWATGRRKVGDETLAASAKMERSSLAFLAGQVPGIESIAGEIALDASVKGQVSAPEILGSTQVTVSRLRLEDRNAPSLRDVEARVQFGRERIVLERLAATVAGGQVEGSGEALLKPGEEPVIRLGLKGSDVLVTRTPDLSVRTDLDLNLAGPWSKASLSGEIGITNSRFFKNFDLLPVGFPSKKPESALPTVDRAPAGGGSAYQDLDLGVKIAPFQDWPVTLRVHTKDAFLIRSNLLESSITADLRLTGTLGHPNPIGAVDIAKGEMSLPFSKIDVETGRVVFDEATGFNGALEFKAKGKADRYQIAIYLYDRILSPQYVLTSIPPMPSEDILTLLATGTTRNELVGDDAGTVAAGKAAGLFLKNLQKKSNEAEGDPTLLDLLEERTELELGRVNPETGEQTFGGKIRLWKQLFFVGDVDQQSDYRALLKYVFRFE